MSIEFVPDLMSVIDSYQGLIVDQWGVLHDGRAPYDGVHEILAEIKRRQKKLVLLTNSGRRTAYNHARLATMGFDMQLIDGIVTSGEAGWLALKERSGPPYDSLGRRCYLITRGGDLGVVEDLDVALAARVEDADFIFLTGVDSPPMTLDDYRPVMEAAAGLGLPIVCSNPDRVAVSAAGLVTAPGTIADFYQQIGGTVHYVGKPNPPIYQACLGLLDGFQRSQILAVGDSLEHDIKGANNAGIDSVLISSGIHQDKLSDPATRSAALDQLFEHYDARPTYLAPIFSL